MYKSNIKKLSQDTKDQRKTLGVRRVNTLLMCRPATVTVFSLFLDGLLYYTLYFLDCLQYTTYIVQAQVDGSAA